MIDEEPTLNSSNATQAIAQIQSEGGVDA